MMSKQPGKSHIEEYYSSIANNYEYLYQETYKELIPLLMKSLDLKPHYIVADIGSGTGLIAENIFESFGLGNPVWCVDPSKEMQDLARKRKGIYPVQKTAEEFFLIRKSASVLTC